MPVRRKRPSKLRGADPPLWSASTGARRGGVRRSRDETIGHGPNRPLNREALTLPTIPPPTADHPEHTIERGNHNSQTRPEANDARIDDALHDEAHEAGTSTTTTVNPVLRAHAARVIERARKRNTITKTHFRSDLSDRAGWYVVCHAVSYDVNTTLFQHAPNLVSNHPIHASNADTGVDFAVPVLRDFDLEHDAVQTEDDFPAQ